MVQTRNNKKSQHGHLFDGHLFIFNYDLYLHKAMLIKIARTIKK